MNNSHSNFDVHLKTDSVIFKDHIVVRKVETRLKNNDGSSQSQTGYYVAAQDQVTVIPFDPYEGKVVLIDSFKIGAIHQTGGCWHPDFPTIKINSDQSLERAAYLAISQQLNTDGLALEMAFDFFNQPELSTCKTTLFCAGIDSTQVEPNETRDLLSLTEIDKALKENYFHNATTVIATQWLLANAARLEKKWQ